MSKRSKNKRKSIMIAQAPKPQTASPPLLNLGYHDAATVVTREHLRTQIIVAGCGGIGAYVVQHVGRLMCTIYDDQKGVNLTLVDPDVVEEKNLGRQLFCEAEVGEPKAVALARRYGQAWGLNTSAYVGEFDEKLILRDVVDLVVLVGCVDNARARATLHEALGNNPERTTPHTLPTIWWLDCGNLKDTGRVLLGSAYAYEQMRGAFARPNPESKRFTHCMSLPSPALQYPSLLIPEPGETQHSALSTQHLSCAELQAANLQSLNINAGIAVQAADMLTRFVVTQDLKRYQCAVNLASGSVKSSYCTPSEVAREIGKPVDYVTRQEGHEEAVMQFLREQQQGAAA